MPTALDIITSAMRKAGVLTKNETPDDDEAQDGLESLNDLLDSWSNESMAIVARTTETYTLTGGDGTYTIGSGADIDTARPIEIAAMYITSGTTDYWLTQIDDETYAKITQKSIQSSLPLYFNYDNANPTATIKLWPVPAAANTLNIVSNKPLTKLSALTTSVVLPPGWNRECTDVAFQVPVGYPATPPYGIYVPTGMRFGTATPSSYTEPAGNQPPFPGTWAIFSWAPGDGEWQVPSTEFIGRASLLSFVRSFKVRFAEGA